MAQPASHRASSDVFISYSRRDIEFVRKLQAGLAAHERTSWVDWEGIPPSAKWMDTLRAAIESSQAFVFVISPHSVASEVCRAELDHAESANKRIVPVVAERVDPSEVPRAATERNWLFFDAGADFDESLAELIHTLDTDPDWLRLHTRLLMRAVEWDSNSRDPSFSLRGRDLATAENWLTSNEPRKDPQPTQLHTEYIVASRAAATRGQRRRIVALGTALVISSVLAVLAFLQFRRAEDEARVAQSRERASSSTFTRETNPDLALALAIEAVQTTETPEAVLALREAIEATHVRLELEHGGTAVSATAVNPSGDVAATGDDEGTVTLWDLSTGDRRDRFDTGGSAVNALAFSPNGRQLAIAGRRATIRPLEGAGEPITLRGHGAKVWSASFDPAGRRLVTAGADGTARIWSWSGDRRAVFRGHPGKVFSAAFSPDGRRVVSGGRDTYVRVWNSRRGSELERFSVHGDSTTGNFVTDVNSVAFHPSGGQVLVGAADGFTRILSLEGDRPIEMPSGQQEVYGVAFDETGDLAAAASLDGKVRVWDAGGGGEDPVLIRTLQGHAGGVNALAFVPGGPELVSASLDGSARVWEATTDDSVLTLKGHDEGVLGVAVEGVGSVAVTSSLDGTIRIWDLESGELRQTLEGKPDAWSPAISADGTRLLAGLGDGTAAVWDMSTGREAVRFGGHGFRVVGAALGQDGNLAVTTSLERRNSAQSWDANTGKRIATFDGHGDYVFSADLDPDAERVVTAGADRVARIWDPQTGEELGALEGHTDWVRDARWSPDGSRIVTASEDSTARVWNAKTYELLQTLRGHDEGVLAAAFSVDGDRIATASSDRTVRVWDPASGTTLDTLEGHEDWVNDVAFLPDGRLLTASYDGTSKVMGCALCITLPELLDVANSELTHELTPEERAQYLHE